MPVAGSHTDQTDSRGADQRAQGQQSDSENRLDTKTINIIHDTFY